MSLNEGTCYAPCRLLHPEAWATVLVIFVHTSSATLRLASTSPQMWRQRRKADSSAAALGLPPVVVARCLSALYVVESSMKRHSFEIGTSSLCLAFSPVEHHFTDTSHSSSAIPDRLCVIPPWVCKASSSPSLCLPHSLNPCIDWGRQCWVSWINLDRRIFPITKREVNNKFVRGNVFQGEWTVRVTAYAIGLPQLLYVVFQSPIDDLFF